MCQSRDRELSFESRRTALLESLCSVLLAHTHLTDR
jgi:hypothetical protein